MKSSPASGASGAAFDLTRLRAELKPFRLHWFGRLTSTSDHAARLRRAGRLYAPAVVLTRRQTAGRGRGNNTWWSDAGVLTTTFVLPIHDRLPPQELPLIAGLAIRNAGALLTGENEISLKWPNDVLYQGRKLAGVLCERITNADMVGIGLNVNVDLARVPVDLRERVTSLRQIAGQILDMTEVLLAVAENLHSQVRRRMEQPFSVFVREYARYDALAGKRVMVTPAGDAPPLAGTCQGIDSGGRLLIRHRGVVHRVIAGQVVVKDRVSRTAGSR